MVYKCTQIIQSWLYPPTCVLCGQRGEPGRDLCAACRRELPYNRPACRRCALPLTTDAGESALCGQCQQQPPAFHAAFSLLRYASPVDHLIQSLKFGRRLQHARLLGHLLADALASRANPRPDLILPVPLHGGRQRLRGFNQAVELARPIARRLGVPLDMTSCRRTRATQAQAQLDANQRRANMRGAFELRQPLEADHVALLDDVVTTGHTANALAQVLRAGGVQIIEVWSIARAAPHATQG